MPAVAVSSQPHSADDLDLGETFFERAAALVLFLVERNGMPGTASDREQQLGEWIIERRRSQQQWSTAHQFAADELGVILRALNGPSAGLPSRLEANGHQQMRWLIARCMAQDNTRGKP
jgi:hypothetical protein